MKAMAILLITSLFGCIAMAQPFTLDKNIKPVELRLINYKAKDSMWNGKINVSKIRQVKDSSYYVVKGLSIYQPVIIKVGSKNKGEKIEIKICKDSWKKADKSGVPDAKGFYQEKFKTEGSFGILIISKSPVVNYNIIVWAGNEVKNLPMPSPFGGKK
jgi:hypothetical protein